VCSTELDVNTSQLVSKMSILSDRRTLAKSIFDIFSVASATGTPHDGNHHRIWKSKWAQTPRFFQLLQENEPVDPTEMPRKRTASPKPS
jgi:hypothetical protein